MAVNEVFIPGYNLSVVVTHPAAPDSGDPVRFGQLTGVAMTDEGDGGNGSTETSVYFGPGVFDLTVDDNEGTGIAVGDAVYYHDTGTGTGSVHLNNSSSGADGFFGYAMEVASANATTEIQVMHVSLGFTLGLIGTAAESNLSTALQGTADGLGVLRVARATFDPSATAGMRTIAAHGLGVTLPDNALVVGGFIDVLTTFTSATDAGTIAIHVQSANDIRTATAISSGTSWDGPSVQAIIPKANTPESTGIKLTAQREITATVAVEALTAGKAVVYLYYVNGA